MTEQLTQPNRPDLISAIEVTEDLELGHVPAWSYSALKTFESCAYRTYISKVKKVPEDFGPAAARGTEIHQQAEDYVQGKLPELPDTLKKFQSKFTKLHALFEEAKVEVEGDWGFTIDWQVCDWMAGDVWARIKLDAFVHETETSGRVIDYKTGKQFGNEIAHSQQALIYAIGSFFRFPELQIVQTEIWYLDHGTTLEQTYTRDEAMQFMPKLHERGITMTTAVKFPPNPSLYNCKWCTYAKGFDPYCQWGIT